MKYKQPEIIGIDMSDNQYVYSKKPYIQNIEINTTFPNGSLNYNENELTNMIYDNIAKKHDMIKFEKEINGKINNFLKFLTIKGIIKEGEYQEFLDSLLIAEKMSNEGL